MEEPARFVLHSCSAIEEPGGESGCVVNLAIDYRAEEWESVTHCEL